MGDLANVRRVLFKFCGMKCWHVTVGGSTVPQFTLALGNKVKRQNPLPNPNLSKEFRKYEGEASLFIRCWWRLERGSSVLASSDDEERTAPMTRISVGGFQRSSWYRRRAEPLRLCWKFSGDFH